MVKAAVAYEADDEAHMDGFEDFAKDALEQSMMWKPWFNPDGIIPSMLITR